MSHIQGTDYVGSMVVMEDGLPSKSEYRRFKVKAVEGNDDFAAMEEVLTRRLTAYLADRERAGEPSAPASSPTRPSCCWSTAARASSAWPCGCVEELGLDDEIPVAVAGQAVRGGLRARAGPIRSASRGSPRRSTCCSGSATRPTASPSPTTASCAASA